MSQKKSKKKKEKENVHHSSRRKEKGKSRKEFEELFLKRDQSLDKFFKAWWSLKLLNIYLFENSGKHVKQKKIQYIL